MIGKQSSWQGWMLHRPLAAYYRTLIAPACPLTAAQHLCRIRLELAPSMRTACKRSRAACVLQWIAGKTPPAVTLLITASAFGADGSAPMAAHSEESVCYCGAWIWPWLAMKMRASWRLHATCNVAEIAGNINGSIEWHDSSNVRSRDLLHACAENMVASVP
eukprot:4114702-Amphidinium_carterae.1